MRSLAGRKIAITRRAEEAGALAARLRGEGAEVSVFTAIRRAPPSRLDPMDVSIFSLRDGVFDGVLFTSPSAVDAFSSRCLELLKEIPGAQVIGAVGPGTAEAASLAGWGADVIVPRRHDGVGLAEAVAGRMGEGLRGMRFLQPRAEEGREEVSRLLGERGAAVSVVPAYRTLASSPEDLAGLWREVREGRLDAAVFASPSAVAATFDAAPRGDAWGEAWGVAIGETTAGALEARGVRRIAVAREATDEGLFQATLYALRR